MKKVLAFVLAMVLVLALSVTAFADEPTTGGTITITGTASTVYTVYKMYDIDIAIDGGQLYQVTEAWADFTAPGYFEVKNDYVIWDKAAVNAVDGAAIAQLAVAYMEGKTFTAVGTADVNNPLAVNEDGYYLLVANDGTANGAVSIVGGENQSVVAKTQDTEYPTLVKKVYEDSTQEYDFRNSVDIGQEILFHNTITVGSNASNYILHDKMDDCMVIDWDSLAVTRGGNEVATTDYDVIKDCHNGCTFHIEFHDDFCKTLLKDAILVVSYKAVLKKDSQVDTAHVNEAWLTHTNGISTEKVSTETYTYKVTVNKVDQAENPLPGATFVLKDNVGKYYVVNEDTGAVTWTSNIAEATKYKTTVENGCQVVFYGVDAEVLTVVEYEVPGGYTGATDIIANTKEFVNGIRSKEVTVVNTRGMALPETGGVGTTMFYGFGALLVAAAVVLLILKKRANSAA